MANRGKKIQRLNVSVHIRGQHLVQQHIYIVARPPHPRDRQRQQLGVRLHRVANFGVAFVIFILAQQKVSVVPGNFGGQRVHGARPLKRLLRAAQVSVGLIGAGQVHPESCGERIILHGPLVVSEFLLRVSIREIELPVAAQQVPSLGVSGLERNATFDYLQPRGTNAMVSEPKPDRLVGEQCAGRQREHQNCRARRGIPGVWAAQSR